MSKVLILYIPVLHKGYIELLQKYNKEVKTLYILGEDITSQISNYKEIRSIEPVKLKKIIRALGFSFTVQILEIKKIRNIKNYDIISILEPISKKFIKKFFPKKPVFYERIFLKWDEKNVKSPSPPHYDSESSDDFDLKMMAIARKISKNSSDWWRQVGAVVTKNKKVIVKAHNQYLPSEHTPYIEGNPRDYIKSGTLGFLATSMHAEQAAISKAAYLGKSLKGADIYLNSYPCPTCAKLISVAGIKRCFFIGGNAYLNVDEVFKASGIRTILVKDRI